MAGPSLGFTEMSLAMSTLLFVKKVQVEDVQVLAGLVMMEL